MLPNWIATMRLLLPRRRPYTVDELIDLMDMYAIDPRPWRARRAKRIITNLPEATDRQLDIVLRTRLRREFDALLQRHGRA